MATKKTATPAQVREWLRSDAGQKAIRSFNEKATAKDRVTEYVGSRGRFQPVHRALFAKAHPNLSYTDNPEAHAKTREFKHRSMTKGGKVTTKTVRLTLAEQRALLGTPDSKGRVDQSAVVAALEAQAGIAPVADAPAPVADGSVEKS